NQIGRQRREPVVLQLCPAIFDRHVLAFDVAGFVEAFVESGHDAGRLGGRACAEPSDHPRRPLLPARREQAGCHPASENAEKTPPKYFFHLISSSARASSWSGTSIESAFAVLRLMTNSNFVGCRIGTSAGLSPFKILPV